MKKLFVAALAVFTFVAVDAQTDFGLTAGYTNLSIKDGDSESGFNVGAFVDLGISDSFSVQPELQFHNAGDLNFFNFNAMAKYGVSEEFSLLAGPQLSFAGGDTADLLEAAFADFEKFNLALGVGVAYDFSESLFAQARYAFQLNDHLDTSGELKVNNLNVGVGYRF